MNLSTRFLRTLAAEATPGDANKLEELVRLLKAEVRALEEEEFEYERSFFERLYYDQSDAVEYDDIDRDSFGLPYRG